MTKSRGILKPRHQWTPEQDAILISLYPCTKCSTLAKFFNLELDLIYRRAKSLNLRKSQWFKDSPMAQRLRNGDNPGVAFRYPKGHVPANKGVKGISYPGMVATQFKPGTRPAKWRPVGSTRVCSKDGYVLMKMAEGINQWRPIHKIIYERMHGKTPAGHAVYFIDGNKLNISICNLSSISLKDNCLRNSVHNYGKEIAKVSQLKAAITRQINKRNKAENEQQHQ